MTNIVRVYRFSALLVSLIGFASSAHAYRAEIFAMHEGKRVAGAEVCLFRGASGIADPFATFLQTDEVTCLPADQVIDIPPGLWHVFARDPRGLISTHPTIFMYDGPPIPEKYYKAVDADMYPAAVLDFPDRGRLDPGHFIAVYYPHSNEFSRPAFQPLQRGTTSMLVRANVPVLPMVVRKGEPVLIGTPLTAKAGERIAYRFETQRDRRHLVTWLFRPKEIPYEHIEGIREPPKVEFVSEGGAKHEPLFAPGRADLSELAVQIFRIPAGGGQIRLYGRYWQRQNIEIPDSGKALQNSGRGLPLEPAGAIRASWTIPDGAQSGGSAQCGVSPMKPAITATVHHCPEGQTSVNDDCLAVARNSTEADENTGTLDLVSVPPGNYLMTTSLSSLVTVDLGPPAAVPVLVTAGRDTHAVTTFPFRSISGRVTRRGKPIQGIIEFSDGATSINSDGRYQIFLARDQPPGLVKVTQCEPRLMFMTITREKVELGGKADFDIPDNELMVRVVDAQSKQVLRDAQVRYIAFKGNQSPEAYGVSFPEVTDAAGNASFHSLPTAVWLQVCSEKAGYAPGCTEKLRVEDRGRELILSLSPSRRLGRLVASPIPRYAQLIWTTASGDVTEEVNVDTQGNFSFNQSHGPNEHLILVSQDQPLYVLPSTPVSDSDLVVTVPGVTTRDVLVRYSSDSEGVVQLRIAGVLIPSEVLVTHQNLRLLGWTLSSRAPLRVPQIANVGSLEVSVVPENVFKQDPARFPELARGFSFKVVPPGNEVLFP